MSQVKILVCSLSLFCLSFSAVAKMRVAVIGAGAAGVAAGHELKINDFDVTLFDSEPRVGGKCFTVEDSGGTGIVELGAIQVGPGYSVVQDFAEKLGHKLRDYWPGHSLRVSAEGAHPLIQTPGAEYLPLRDEVEILKEIVTLSAALKRFKSINDSHFKEIPADSEFNQPFEQWIDQLQLPHFKEIFRMWITSYGYGQLDAVPAYFPLYLINSSVGLAFMTHANMNLRMLVRGYGPLLQDIVADDQIPVELGVQINRVIRTSGQVTLTWRKNGHESSQQFDYLVIACGLECIQKIGMKLTQEESILLDELRFSPYDVAIAQVPGLPKGGYVLPENLASPGHISLMSKNTDGGEDVVIYVPRGGVRSVRDPIVRQSEEQITQRVQEDLAKFGFQDVTVSRVQYWDNYFPHFNQPFAYTLLDEIQGKNQTIYVGSIGRFEIVEKAMTHAIDVVREKMLKRSDFVEQQQSWWSGVWQFLSWEFGAQRKEH